MIKKFVEFNKAWCLDFLEKHPLDKKNINNVYRKIVKKHLREGMLIYDVGGGKNCRYLSDIDFDTMEVVTLDISDEELDLNTGIKEKIQCDVCKTIPIPKGNVDMITSSSVCEHLLDPKSYYENAYNALKPGGTFINMFPCRYAVFATINRILPKEFARKVLYFFLPGAKKDCGFPAYYERLYFDQVMEDLKNQGFEVTGVYTRYLQCDYYIFLIPLFLLNYAWDALTKALGLRNLASHMLVVAKKPEK